MSTNGTTEVDGFKQTTSAWLDGLPDHLRQAVATIVSEKRLIQAALSEVSAELIRPRAAEKLVKTIPTFLDVFGLIPLYDRLKFRTPLLVKGPKGDGKSLSSFVFAHKERAPIVVIEGSEDTKKSVLEGNFILAGDKSPFVLGAIPTAIEIANECGQCILLIEEINALPPQIQKELNHITDWKKQITVDPIRKTFELREGAKLWVMATMNPSVYGGTYDLNEDLRSRFIEIEVGYAEEEQEKEIVRAVCGNIIQPGMLDQVIRLARETRQPGTFQYGLSTRDVCQFVQTIEALNIEHALQLLACKFESQDRKVLANRIDSIFGLKVRKHWASTEDAQSM